MCRKQPGVGELIFTMPYCSQVCLTCSFVTSAIGRLCEKCESRAVVLSIVSRNERVAHVISISVICVGDGKCVICDSYVRPCTLVRICDECNYGSYQGRCTICGGPGVSDAYYCKECTIMEKDVRDVFCAAVVIGVIYVSIIACCH